MATETISVRERIQRMVRLTVAGISGIGTVYRWDMRGLRDPVTGLGVDNTGARLTLKALDASVMADDETAADGAQGNVGSTINTLPLEIHLKLAQADTETLGTECLVNRWLYAIEKALMANRRQQEPAGVGNAQQLAIDTRVTARAMSDPGTGQRELIAALRIEVTYETDSGDPAIGPGITALTETI